MEKGIMISLDHNEKGVKMTFSGMDPKILKEFPTKNVDLLARALSIEFLPDTSEQRLTLLLPRKMGFGTQSLHFLLGAFGKPLSSHCHCPPSSKWRG